MEAHKWLNLAAERGSAEAAAERDALAKEMTAEERAEARKLARVWQGGGAETAAARPSATPPKAASPPASAGAPPERALKEAQTLLSALGYQPGIPDGKWDKRSIRAYRAFLREAGIRSSDVLTPAALRAMRRMARDRKPATEPAPKPAVGLHQVAQAGDLEGLKAALKGKADVNGRDARGWTPLMHAVNKGYVLMVPPLLEAGADVNLRAPDGATALFIAALHGHASIVEHLMKAGADASLKGPKGRTVVDLAASREDPDLVALFLSPRAKELAEKLGRDFSPKVADGNGWTDLHYAAALNLPVLAKFLLAGGADPNARSRQDGKALGDRRTLRELGYSPNQWENRYGQTPLHVAGANYETVKVLVEGGGDVNATNRYKNVPACCPPLYALLLQEKTAENSEVVKLLIANGADVNAPTDDDGWTMLHRAWTSSMAERLIALGADVNARTKSGSTPLMSVNAKNKNEMYALLLERGADVNAADNNGYTALYYPVVNGNTDAVKLLLRHGANVNAPIYSDIPAVGGRVPGHTLLHIAVTFTRIDMVKLLIEHGADPGARTYAVPHLLRPITARQFAEHQARNKNWDENSRREVREIAKLLGGGRSRSQEQSEEQYGGD